MNWIMQNWDQLAVAILAVVGAASAIAALTPTPKDDAAIAWIRKIVDVIAFNFANAKNAKK